MAKTSTKGHSILYIFSLLKFGNPEGFGKVYKSNGSVYIGQFLNGKASGTGRFITPEGFYYHGEFNNNLAESDNGFYQGKDFRYTGGFANNIFHGYGKQ
jgi:hypothetical protein